MYDEKLIPEGADSDRGLNRLHGLLTAESTDYTDGREFFFSNVFAAIFYLFQIHNLL